MSTHELDTSTLDAAPAIIRDAYARGWRVYLVTTWTGGEQHHRTGRVGKTMGWRPAFLLLSSSRASSSSDLLDATTWERTVVAGVQYAPGRPYREPGTHRVVKPGRNRWEVA